MRLRELSYPIAVLSPDSLAGGKNAGLSSTRRWDYNIADYFLKGGFDDAIIYDAAGRKFEIAKILLSPSQWWWYLGDVADNLFLRRSNKDPANVDMELRQVGQLTLGEFCEELRGIALEHPSWWKRHSTEHEIRSMFEGCSTFAEAIDDIGILDEPQKERVKGRSDKTVDFRK